MPELNVTGGLTDLLGTPSAPSWGGTVIMVFGSVMFLMFAFFIFVWALSNFERYKKVRGWIAFFFRSTAFFAFGLLTLGIIAVPLGICYYFINQAKKGNTLPIGISFALIGGYIIISLIGWLSKKFIYDRINKFEKKIEKK